MYVGRSLRCPSVSGKHAALVGQEHAARGRRLCLDEGEPGRFGAVTEESPAGACEGRDDDELESVYEVCCEQALGQGDAAVDADVASRLRLQLFDIRRDRGLDLDGSVPLAGQRPGGEDVLGGRVDEVGEGRDVDVGQ